MSHWLVAHWVACATRHTQMCEGKCDFAVWNTLYGGVFDTMRGVFFAQHMCCSRVLSQEDAPKPDWHGLARPVPCTLPAEPLWGRFQVKGLQVTLKGLSLFGRSCGCISLSTRAVCGGVLATRQSGRHNASDVLLLVGSCIASVVVSVACLCASLSERVCVLCALLVVGW